MKANMSGFRKGRLQGNQDGLAAIVITLVLMIVITLIVLGFTQISRRNQRESLDSQLSTQAYYAAETGVNQVQQLMKDGSIASKDSCAEALPYKQLSDTANGVSNSCLLVDPTPTVLGNDSLDSSGEVLPIQSANRVDSSSDSLTLKWYSNDKTPAANAGSCPSSFTTFPTNNSSGWNNCPYGVLRFDLVDVTNAGTLTPASLESSNLTIFAPPSASHAVIAHSGGAAGLPTPGNVQCSYGTNPCSLTLTGMHYSHTYYIRVTSLYKPVKLSISGGQASGAVQFVGAQVVVDSTGKAQDVLRRVRISLRQNVSKVLPEPLASSGDVCKIFTVTPGYSAGDCSDPNPPSGGGGGSDDGGGDADAQVYVCSSNCGGLNQGGPGGTYHWSFPFTNISQNPPSDVSTCTWEINYADGSQTINGQDCNNGETLNFTFPVHSGYTSNSYNGQSYPMGCQALGGNYTLTEYLKNGSTKSYFNGFAYPLCW